MKTYQGSPVCAGVVCGPALFYCRVSAAPPLAATGDARAELARFEEAVARALAGLRELHATALSGAGPEAAAIFDVHSMMLEDPNFSAAVRDALSRGLSAAAAALEAGEGFAVQLEALPDPYLSERAADVRDVARRVADLLSGVADLTRLTRPSVLVADDLTPGEAIGLDSAMLIGLVLRGGSANSHTAALIRALDVPAVFGVGGALPQLADGTELLVDGTAGTVVLEPDEPTRAYAQTLKKNTAALEEDAGGECVTRDGVAIEVCANIGSAGEVARALAAGATGVGLFRSEYLFLSRASLPTEEEQLAAYRAALEAAGDRRVVVRTLDLGADKRTDCLALPQEENPALGCRALRLCLARPELFLQQLCALYRASVYGRLAVMFPLIASEWELDAALAAAAEARAVLTRRGVPFAAEVPLGIMIETPAAALMSAQLARKAAFFSIGTNDLTQYTLAADRQNPEAARYYSQSHPAVLRLIGLTVRGAAQHSIPVAVCGELAADPVAVPALLALGVRELSVPPARIAAVRATVRKTDTLAARAALPPAVTAAL